MALLDTFGHKPDSHYMSPRRRERKPGSPSALWDILEKVFGRRGLKGRIKENQVFTVWEGAVGEAIASNARPVAVREGVLTIEAKNNTWLQELSFLKEELMGELNKALGWEAITDLRFRVAGDEISPQPLQVVKAEIKQPPVDTATEREIDSHIEGISDPELREALKGFMTRGASLNRRKVNEEKTTT